MMHLKCGNFLDNALSVSSKSEEAKNTRYLAGLDETCLLFPPEKMQLFI